MTARILAPSIADQFELRRCGHAGPVAKAALLAPRLEAERLKVGEHLLETLSSRSRALLTPAASWRMARYSGSERWSLFLAVCSSFNLGFEMDISSTSGPVLLQLAGAADAGRLLEDGSVFGIGKMELVLGGMQQRQLGF